MSNLAKDWQEDGYNVYVKNGEVEVSAIRAINKNYLSCTTVVHKRYVATARYAPEDEFSLSMGVALAMDRLSKELSKDKIEVGDKVKIKDYRLTYDSYIEWVVKNITDVGLAACYSYGNYPPKEAAEYMVKAIAPWVDKSKNKLVYIQRYYVFKNGEIDTFQPCFLMAVDGLEKV